MEKFGLPYPIYIIASFICAILISYFSVPPIVKLARATKVKGLRSLPNGRTSHSSATPTLGGVAIFVGFVISSLIFPEIGTMPQGRIIVAGCIILFFSGLKDDIFIISPLSKLLSQILATAIIIVFANIRFTNLHGFLGFTEINYFFSFILTTFVVIVIINAFNLIDGIDGLASSIGILCALFFGIWFYLLGEYNGSVFYYNYSIISFALVGALLGFIRYNLMPASYKIFMGDTGSLLIGFVISILVIQFNESNILICSPYKIHSVPAISIAILIIPLYDTLRVMVVRIARKQSPFKADRGHIHHKLIDLGYSHAKATLILVITNIIFICIAMLLQHIGILWLTIALFVIATLVFYIPISMIKKRDKKILISEKHSKI